MKKMMLFSLKNIVNVLSRSEMKRIMAGGSESDCKFASHCEPQCEKKEPGGGYLCSTCCLS